MLSISLTGIVFFHRVWDLRHAKSCLCQMSGHTYAVRRVRCSPYTAGTVASSSYDFTVRYGLLGWSEAKSDV